MLKLYSIFIVLVIIAGGITSPAIAVNKGNNENLNALVIGFAHS